MMRRHEKEFMLRGTKKYPGRVVKRGTEFEGLLAKSSVSDNDKAELKSSMNTYQAEMKKFGALSIKLGFFVKRLSSIYAEMADAAKAVR